MTSTSKSAIKNLTLSAMFLAIGLVLPLFTGQIKVIGTMLLPMHLPVFLCGLICGWPYGAAVGFILPLLRHSIFFMPPMPQGIVMAFELAAYGFLVGFLYARSKWKCVAALYRCLIAAMLGGRVVWALGRVILAGMGSVPFGWKMFLTAGFVEAVPGLILQLTLIPAIMIALGRTGLVPFGGEKPAPEEG